MKLVLSSLLLASLYSPRSGSSVTVQLTQIPAITVPEGETVNISCCWTENYERFSVSIKNNRTNQNLSYKTYFKNSSDCSSLVITNVTVEHSGIYVCQMTVDIPVLKDIMGDGTVVSVIPKGGKEGKTEGLSLANIVLAVVVPLLVSAVTGLCWVLRRKQERVTRVIYEVPHTDSDVDKDSTSSSRGSSEWRQVPLYDYFERVQAPHTKSVAVLERSSASLQHVDM